MVTAKLSIRPCYKTGGGYILSALDLNNKVIRSNWFKSQKEAMFAAERIAVEYQNITGQPLSINRADVEGGITQVRTKEPSYGFRYIAKNISCS